MARTNTLAPSKRPRQRTPLLVGLGSGLDGVAITLGIAIQWFTRSISHEMWALVGATLLVFAVQIFWYRTLTTVIAAISEDTLD